MLRFISSIVLAALVLGTTAAARAATNSSALVPAPLVQHIPAQPKSSQPVTITARVNGAGGVSQMKLHVQVVEPGNYLRKTDAEFTNSWRELPMSITSGVATRGLVPDTKSLRSHAEVFFTAILPPELQQHRRLIRYFVSWTDASGATGRVPVATNDCPNFAYFVYDGLPAFTGASEPGRTPPLTFPAEFMDTLPAYHLIARKEEVEQSQWDGGANKKRFFGTLVYDGRVYDHIQFHNRGKGSTYVAGKNKWGFKFNAGHAFHDRDLWGRATTNELHSVSLTACASPWAQVNRGMAGMDEAVSFRAFQLAGVPSSSTHWIQFRVISRTNEVSARSQYSGDLWGLYQVVTEPGGEWLHEQGLPDGDIYSPETGVKHHAKNSPTNDVAFQKFMEGSQRGATEAWWRTNLDLPRYYTFHALNRVLGNVDVRPGANHYLYRAPDGRWGVIPWDLDMMFIAKTHQPGFVDQVRCLDVPALKLEYRNRAREVLDLFCSDTSTNGGQIGQLVDELSKFLLPANQPRTWPELDMVMWNQHPRSNARGQFYVTPFRDGRMGGEWTRTLATPDFAGYSRYITDYGTDSRPTNNYAINDGDQRGYGFGYLSVEARDRRIPERPVIQLVGQEHKEAGFRFKIFGQGPEKNFSGSILKFEISDFKASAAATNSVFAALQWRVGEISGPGLSGHQPGAPRRYEIEELWRSEELPAATNQFVLSLTMCHPQHTYRARARFQDNTGRWSHWSEPVQFVAR